MKRIPGKQIAGMESSISPQLFKIEEDSIVYFDKINLHEGRFCLLKNGVHKVLFEIGEGQVEIQAKGEFFHFALNENLSIISMLSNEGSLLRKITLEGIFFDVVKDSYGNYICLGNRDGCTVIKIINKMGMEAGSITPVGILFGSCIYVEEDDIYMGGFDEKNNFKVMMFNYIGNKKHEWILKFEPGDRVITKIQRCMDDLIMSITGGNESIMVLNMSTGKHNEIYASDMELKYILDFNIKEDKVLVMDGKSIYEFEMKELGGHLDSGHRKSSGRDYSLLAYQYLMYSRGIGDCIESGFVLTFFAFTAGCVYMFLSMEQLFISFSRIALFLPCFFWATHYTIAVFRNMVIFIEKAARIEKLLSLYNFDSGKKLINHPIYSGLMITSSITLVLLPEINLIVSILPGALCFLILYYIDKYFVTIIASHNKDIIIELLQPEDQGFRDYIQKTFESIRRNNCEKICVVILLGSSLKDNIIEKWAKSRRGIIQGIEEATVQNDRVTAVLDMSKRDIKYSRVSIIMDFICFIKREVKIEEIEIAFRDDKR